MELEVVLFGRRLDQLEETIAYSRRLDCVWKFIQRDFGDSGLRLQDACRSCGVSRSHLNVLMDERIGFSFHQLLNRYRLWQAARLLKARDFTFLEVALETGFENYDSLSRHIQSVMGLTPKEFRRRLTVDSASQD